VFCFAGREQASSIIDVKNWLQLDDEGTKPSFLHWNDKLSVAAEAYLY